MPVREKQAILKLGKERKVTRATAQALSVAKTIRNVLQNYTDGKQSPERNRTEPKAEGEIPRNKQELKDAYGVQTWKSIVMSAGRRDMQPNIKH